MMAQNDLVTNVHKEVILAGNRIKDYVRRTPLEYSFSLSEKGKGNVYLKLENEQVMGSFKSRGAFNKMLYCLERDPKFIEKGVTLASSGNHALACVNAMKKLGVHGKIFLPTVASKVKQNYIRQLGGDICLHGEDCMIAEVAARKSAKDNGMEYLSPYNDVIVVAGQGTISMEILEDLPDVDFVLVPVGGGGLVGGIAAYVKCVKPCVKVIGVQPKQSKVMYESIKAGKIIYEECNDTLSDGTAGGIEEGSVTFDICRDAVDDWILVEEEDIALGVYTVLENHHKVIEGAAGMVVGGYLKNYTKFEGKNVVLIMCGANIGMDPLKDIINRYA